LVIPLGLNRKTAIFALKRSGVAMDGKRVKNVKQEKARLILWPPA